MSTSPSGTGAAGQLLDQRAQPARHEGAAGVDADQRHPLAVRIALHDLVGDPHERSAQVVPVEDDPSLKSRRRTRAGSRLAG